MPHIRNRIALFSMFGAGLLLQGCVAKTAFDIATAPVKIAGKAVDAATTSQSEADEKRGREIRKREEELGKLERQYHQQRARCADGDQKACKEARDINDAIQRLTPGIAVSPDRH